MPTLLEARLSNAAARLGNLLVDSRYTGFSVRHQKRLLQYVDRQIRQIDERSTQLSRIKPVHISERIRLLAKKNEFQELRGKIENFKVFEEIAPLAESLIPASRKNRIRENLPQLAYVRGAPFTRPQWIARKNEIERNIQILRKRIAETEETTNSDILLKGKLRGLLNLELKKLERHMEMEARIIKPDLHDNGCGLSGWEHFASEEALNESGRRPI